MSILSIASLVGLVALAQLVPPPERRTCLIERSPAGSYAAVTISTDDAEQGYLLSLCDAQFRCSAKLHSPINTPLSIAWASTGELLVLADSPSPAGERESDAPSSHPDVEIFDTTAEIDRRRAMQPARSVTADKCTAPSPVG